MSASTAQITACNAKFIIIGVSSAQAASGEVPTKNVNQIVEAQHKFENVVTASMHIHLAKDKCLEIIAVKGKASNIRSLSQELTTKKGVKELKITAIAL